MGEIHKGLVLLSESKGMLSAIAHGALKPGSRLSSGTEPLTLARVFLYHDPVKDSYKVTDLTVTSSFEAVKLDILRFFRASLWVEVVLRSLGGGATDASVFALLRDALDALDRAPESGVEVVDLQFLWRFIGLAGYRPDPDICSCCGRRVAEEDPMLYLPGERGVHCPSCASRLGAGVGGPCLEMSPGARRYLAHTLGMDLGTAVRVSLSRPAAGSLRRLTAELLQSVLEARLKVLEAGAGIL